MFPSEIAPRGVRKSTGRFPRRESHPPRRPDALGRGRFRALRWDVPRERLRGSVRASVHLCAENSAAKSSFADVWVSDGGAFGEGRLTDRWPPHAMILPSLVSRIRPFFGGGGGIVAQLERPPAGGSVLFSAPRGRRGAVRRSFWEILTDAYSEISVVFFIESPPGRLALSFVCYVFLFLFDPHRDVRREGRMAPAMMGSTLGILLRLRIVCPKHP